MEDLVLEDDQRLGDTNIAGKVIMASSISRFNILKTLIFSQSEVLHLQKSGLFCLELINKQYSQKDEFVGTRANMVTKKRTRRTMTMIMTMRRKWTVRVMKTLEKNLSVTWRTIMMGTRMRRMVTLETVVVPTTTTQTPKFVIERGGAFASSARRECGARSTMSTHSNGPYEQSQQQ